MNSFDRLELVYNQIRPVIDICLLAFVIYKAYNIIVKTHGMQIVKGLLALGLAYTVAFVLNLTTMLWLLNTIAPWLIVCVAIVFQPELRKIFLKLGQGDWFKLGTRTKHTYVDSVLIAADMLSKQKLIYYSNRSSSHT